MRGVCTVSAVCFVGVCCVRDCERLHFLGVCNVDVLGMLGVVDGSVGVGVVSAEMVVGDSSVGVGVVSAGMLVVGDGSVGVGMVSEGYVRGWECV